MPAEDNRDFVDTNTAQKLTPADIKELRSKGASGSEIIEALAKNSSTYASKTDFSKAKWMKKKFKKYSPKVMLRSTNAFSLCNYLFNKHNRWGVSYLRNDSLARMLSFGNIHGGMGQVIICETVGGLLLGAAMEKVGDFENKWC